MARTTKATKATKASPTGATEPPLTARIVANLCGVELKTVHNWVAKKLLDHFRTPGRHLRFQRADVERFIAKGSHRAEPEPEPQPVPDPVPPPVPEPESNVVDAAVLYAKRQTKTGLARLKKAVAALPKAS